MVGVGGWKGDLLRVWGGYRSSSSCIDGAGYDFLFDGDQELEVNMSSLTVEGRDGGYVSV
jgi:hypothetical protein